jgi:1-acyl-sn-glycerol-3-phosphate acyltransferase
LRGALALSFIVMLFPLGDLIQRIIVANRARRHPQRRDAILYAWIQRCAEVTLRGILGRVGGARFGAIPEIEARPGVLVLMNHQSLLDIPIAVKAVRGTYPWIVTRRRYAQGIPLVSHMLRLYNMPLVDPGRQSAEQFGDLARRGAEADRPLLIFPEGTRTRDGEIRPFKRGGLRALLPQRDWEVYLLVVDGFWQCAHLSEFVRGVAQVQGRFRLLGPFPTQAASVDPETFSEMMHTRMEEALALIRSESDDTKHGGGRVLSA